MNPLTNVRNISKLSERELTGGDGKTSWHDEYRESAWIFIGGLPFELSEGDIIAVFSQYGEPVNLNLVRHKDTGKSRGFAFLCYEDQKSTILAVDNFNGIKIMGRTIRVDHVKDYKPPKDSDKLDDITKQLYIKGCGPGVELPVLQQQSQERQDEDDDDFLAPPPSPPPEMSIKSEPVSSRDSRFQPSDVRKQRIKEKEPLSEMRKRKNKEESAEQRKSKKSRKKEKKKKSKKSKKRKKKESSSSSEESSSSSSSEDEDKHRSSKKRR